MSAHWFSSQVWVFQLNFKSKCMFNMNLGVKLHLVLRIKTYLYESLQIENKRAYTVHKSLLTTFLFKTAHNSIINRFRYGLDNDRQKLSSASFFVTLMLSVALMAFVALMSQSGLIIGISNSLTAGLPGCIRFPCQREIISVSGENWWENKEKFILRSWISSTNL